jgi:spheroidene monooxygenase
METQAAPQDAVTGVVVVLLVNLRKTHRSWGWMKLAQGASPLRNLPGVKFAKVMGSGHEGGFGLRPSATHQGLIVVLENGEQADAFLQSDWVAQYKTHADEWCSCTMSISSSRGQWNQVAWLPSEPVSTESQDKRGWVATLTRASIRPASTMAFWRYAPAAQADLSDAPGCVLAMGLGEAPLVRQCTFSIWRDTESMLNYAHTGAHQAAIQAAYKHSFFSESMFVRMRVLRTAGVWHGVFFGHDDALGAAHA